MQVHVLLAQSELQPQQLFSSLDQQAENGTVTTWKGCTYEKVFKLPGLEIPHTGAVPNLGAEGTKDLYRSATLICENVRNGFLNFLGIVSVHLWFLVFKQQSEPQLSCNQNCQVCPHINPTQARAARKLLFLFTAQLLPPGWRDLETCRHQLRWESVWGGAVRVDATDRLDDLMVAVTKCRWFVRSSWSSWTTRSTILNGCDTLVFRIQLWIQVLLRS